MLVATDCLSEGVNLQDGFAAVVHYDLAWNPTRHEQREGRVDRFGQRADTVRAVTFYGEDNGIDGIVLDVLIRRHENIRRSTGVSVPVPVDSTTVMKAIWESLLLRGKRSRPAHPRLRRRHHRRRWPTQLDVQWIDAAEREKASRSRFRQAGLQPDDVAADPRRGPPLPRRPRRRRDASPATPWRCSAAQLADTADGFTARIDTLPAALRDQLPPAKDAAAALPPVAAGPDRAQRADPHRPHRRSAVALRPRRRPRPDSRPDAATGPPRRGDAHRAVSKVTTLLVVRFRFELTLPGSRTHHHPGRRRRPVPRLHRHRRRHSTWLHDRRRSTRCSPRRRPATSPTTLARAQLDRALDRLPDLRPAPRHHRRRPSPPTLVADHRAVRAASRAGGRAVTAKLLPPPDVLGVYVFLPDRSAADERARRVPGPSAPSAPCCPAKP